MDPEIILLQLQPAHIPRPRPTHHPKHHRLRPLIERIRQHIQLPTQRHHLLLHQRSRRRRHQRHPNPRSRLQRLRPLRLPNRHPILQHHISRPLQSRNPHHFNSNNPTPSLPPRLQRRPPLNHANWLRGVFLRHRLFLQFRHHGAGFRFQRCGGYCARRNI